MTSRSHRSRLHRANVLFAAVFLVLAAHLPAGAGMYTWVDDQGDRHLVDSREKVPPKYRSRARELPLEEPRPGTPSGREAEGSAGAEPPKLGSGKSDQAARGRSSPSLARTPEATAGWLDRLRARWVVSVPALPSVRQRIDRWLPREAALRMAGVIAGAVMLVRGVGALGALRAARGLAVFGGRYRGFLERRGGRVEPAQLDLLERSLPSVHRWCRAAKLGVTTIGASREVGMGRVMDEGRVDVLRACLTRPELVGQHVLAMLGRAEGVHRHRARRPLSPLGCFELFAYWPRYLVWRTGEDEQGGVRVLLVLYWLAVLGWAAFG